jgi:hypothetical protein
MFLHCLVSTLEGRPFSEVHARQMISKISREELEDKFLRLQEDNTVRVLQGNLWATL